MQSSLPIAPIDVATKEFIPRWDSHLRSKNKAPPLVSRSAQVCPGDQRTRVGGAWRGHAPRPPSTRPVSQSCTPASRPYLHLHGSLGSQVSPQHILQPSRRADVDGQGRLGPRHLRLGIERLHSRHLVLRQRGERGRQPMRAQLQPTAWTDATKAPRGGVCAVSTPSRRLCRRMARPMPAPLAQRTAHSAHPLAWLPRLSCMALSSREKPATVRDCC